MAGLRLRAVDWSRASSPPHLAPGRTTHNFSTLDQEIFTLFDAVQEWNNIFRFANKLKIYVISRIERY